MTNKNLILGNWKANQTIEQTQNWIDSWNTKPVITIPNTTLTVAGPHTSLHLLTKEIKNITVCAQDVSSFPIGRYTGEIPAELLKGLTTYCLIGHSERRRHLNETKETIGQKFNRLIESGIIPVVCAQSLEDIPQNCFESKSEWFILYESETAISTDAGYRPEDPKSVSEKLQLWKNTIKEVPVLYGGSVTQETAKSFFDLAEISGLGIGNASLDAQTFYEIVSKLA